VQFIENNVFGVRAAVYTLARKGGASKFLIFPMIHIGCADYYGQVRKRLETCDVILFEGVRTMRSQVVTLSYRLIAKRRRLGLVVQGGASLFSGIRARLIHADVAPGEFNDNWSRIPWHIRIAIMILAPLYGAFQFLTATKESIGRRLKTEDLASSDDVLRGDFAPELDDAILSRRDAKLVAAIESLVTAAATEATIGIVYGAAHMKAVTTVLMEKHHYRVAESEWITVFDYVTA
jgi:hypothetical protein